MGRASTKENKNRYQLIREELGLSREKASELLEILSPERLEKIENERTDPHPDEVLLMSQKYKKPSLCNYYCSNQCPIGQQYVPEVQVKELSSIVLEMLASLNAVHKQKDRLIEIAADGKISGEEIDDFIYIQEELERISITVETLQLWSEKMLANGIIDPVAYRAKKKNNHLGGAVTCAAYFAAAGGKTWAILRISSCFFPSPSHTIVAKRRWMPMTPRERILALRLLEKQERKPEYTAGIGIQVRIVTKDSGKMEEKHV